MSKAVELLENPALQAAVIGVGLGFGNVVGTTVHNHRKWTHQSIEEHGATDFVLRSVIASHGIRPRIWARVHTTHHRFPDSSFRAQVEIADLVDYREAHGITEPPLPESFSNLDPVAKDLSLAEVLMMGRIARQDVIDEYDPPTSYSPEDSARILDTDTPRYVYNKYATLLTRFFGRQEGTPRVKNAPPRSFASIQHKLRDPHSPALAEFGTLGILLGNVGDYKETAAGYQNLENQGADYGKDKWDERIFDRSKLCIAAKYAGCVLLLEALGFKEPHTAKQVATRFGLGVVAGALADGILIGGGAVTDGFGHTVEAVADIVRGFKRLPPKVKADGSFTNDSRIGSRITADEVGGQKIHHDYPWLIAYTLKQGAEKFSDKPLGTTLEWLADRNIFIKRGKQFGNTEILKETESRTLENAKRPARPDEASDAVLMMMRYRVRSLKKDGLVPHGDSSLRILVHHFLRNHWKKPVNNADAFLAYYRP